MKNDWQHLKRDLCAGQQIIQFWTRKEKNIFWKNSKSDQSPLTYRNTEHNGNDTLYAWQTPDVKNYLHLTNHQERGSLGRSLKQWFETVLDYWEQGMIGWRRTILLSRDGVVGAIIVPSIRQFLLPLWPNTCRLFGVPLSCSKTQGKCEKFNVIILRFNARWTEGSLFIELTILLRTKSTQLLHFSSNLLEDIANPQFVRDPQVGNHWSKARALGLGHPLNDFRRTEHPFNFTCFQFNF